VSQLINIIDFLIGLHGIWVTGLGLDFGSLEQDGYCVKVWEDRWVDGHVLKEKFPRLYMISQCTDSVVGDLVQMGHITSEGCSNWSLTWRRKRFVWEKHEEEQLLALISKVRWSKDKQDKLVWIGDNVAKQEYTVKSGYNVLYRGPNADI